jgi:hypothetical protein
MESLVKKKKTKSGLCSKDDSHPIYGAKLKEINEKKIEKLKDMIEKKENKLLKKLQKYHK